MSIHATMNWLILLAMNSFTHRNSHFNDRKVSVKKTIEILAKSNIQVNEQEASVILDFLYHIAQCYNKQDALKTLSRYRTDKK